MQRVSKRFFGVVAMAIFAVLPCVVEAGGGRYGNPDGVRGVLWHRDDYFVRIEKQDRLRNGDAPPRNNHPYRQITAEGVVAALSNVLIQEDASDPPQLFFSQRALDILATYIPEGLEKAKPNEDVTFAVKSWHEKALTFATPLVLTGRVFVRDGALNVILGEMRPPNKVSQSYAELRALNKDPRLHPYTPGLRGYRVRNKYVLSAVGDGIYHAPNRPQDWLIFTPSSYSAFSRPLQAITEEIRGDAVEDLAKRKARRLKPRAKGTQSAEELRRLRDEVTRLKKRVDGETSKRRSAALEARLKALERMRERGLISEEEFERKREDVLKDL